MRRLAPFLFLPLVAQARVFDYKEASVAGYVRGTTGTSVLDQDAFIGGSENASVAGKSTYNYGAEIGVMLALKPNFHLRIGAEVIQERPVTGAGVDSSGNTLFQLNSTVFIFNPNVTFEYVFKAKGNTRFFAELGAGYANVSVSNAYSNISSGRGDFSDTFQGNTISGTAGLGMEMLFADNATFVLDAGYRYLPVTDLTYRSTGTNFVGSFQQGQAVTNSDGTKRNLNLSGGFAGVAFRFYLN